MGSATDLPMSGQTVRFPNEKFEAAPICASSRGDHPEVAYDSSIPQPDSGNPKYSEVFRSDPQSKKISRPNFGSKFAMKNDTYFLPYQRAWIEDKSPLKIIGKSRQIGISHADAYDSVVKAAMRDITLDAARPLCRSLGRVPFVLDPRWSSSFSLSAFLALAPPGPHHVAQHLRFSAQAFPRRNFVATFIATFIDPSCPSEVAQVSNLLFRRLPACSPCEHTITPRTSIRHPRPVKSSIRICHLPFAIRSARLVRHNLKC